MRLLAKLVRELAPGEATLADLVEALKMRCARLGIRWTNDAIGEALRLVGSNRPLGAPARPAGARLGQARAAIAPRGDGSPSQAAAVLAQLVAGVAARQDSAAAGRARQAAGRGRGWVTFAEANR